MDTIGSTKTRFMAILKRLYRTFLRASTTFLEDGCEIEDSNYLGSKSVYSFERSGNKVYSISFADKLQIKSIEIEMEKKDTLSLLRVIT